MRTAIQVSVFALFLCSAMQAAADPAPYHPADCAFALTFPGKPALTLLKANTDRGDAILTHKAELHMDVDGKANLFRAECTHIAHMGFVDEQILSENMHALAEADQIQNFRVSLERSSATGPVGLIHGTLQVDGKALTVELRRYTGKTEILDVWTGAEGDAPSDAGIAFLKSLTLDGQGLP